MFMDYLKQYQIDSETLMKRIDDLIIKTIISAENLIYNGTKMFVPQRDNCFELFGFDILVDQDIKPWLIEVNLTPSLSPEESDFSVKSSLISNLFTLAGVPNQNSVLKIKDKKDAKEEPFLLK